MDLEAGDLERAKQHLEAAAALEERASSIEGRFRWFVARGRVADAEGDPEDAIQLLDQAERLYLRGFFPDLRPIPAMKARVWIAQGKLSEAADWARERGVSARDDVAT
jgi:LuxR family maltose regulon positive regulatory protein